jgi:putative NADH-flavin reductase
VRPPGLTARAGPAAWSARPTGVDSGGSHLAEMSGLFPETMRLLILGATGKTGTQLVDLAARRGHSVTAFVRSPSKLARINPGLEVVRGDPHSTDELSRVLPGHDAVLSALGVRPPAAFRPHSLVEDCAASTIAAMTTIGVKRLILVSAAVLFPEKGLYIAFFQWLLKHTIRDLAAAEDLVRATPLDWTIARPPRLTGASETTYRSATESLPPRGYSMSSRALATFILDAAEGHTHVRETVGLAG